MRRLVALCLLVLALSATSHAFAWYASWPTHTATVYVNPGNASPWLSPDQIGASVVAAMDDWNTQGGADFRFVFGGFTDKGQDAYDGQNTISFAPNNPNGYIAFTFARADGNLSLLDTDTVFYSGFNYTSDDQDCAAVGGYGVVLHDVLTHELGRVLGLSSSDDPEATMYAGGFPPCATTNRSLGLDDIAGVQAIYGVASALPPPPDPIPPPPITACVTDGVVYPVGATLTATLRNGAVGVWIAAREVEGWTLLTSTHRRGYTTATVQCGAS